MTNSASRALKVAALQHIEARLAVSPSELDLLFSRACLLADLGRTDEAKSAYLALLTRDPAHLGTLLNFGTLLYDTGFKSAARTLYTQAVTHHPTNAIGHANLANILAQGDETEQARVHFDTALRMDPDLVEAHRGLGYLLSAMGDEDGAARHRRIALQGRAMEVQPYVGEGTPLSLLVLVSALGGMVPIRHHLDSRLFQVTVLFVEAYEPSMQLPDHQLMVNAIGDADLCAGALEIAAEIVAGSRAPVINHPSAVSQTGRVVNAARLGRIPGVVTPKTLLLPRQALAGAGAALLPARAGITFPFLLRSPGFHTGQYFIRVDNEPELATKLPDLPGPDLLIMQYLDARDADGDIRKYRVMLIDGEIYPLHVAIAQDWKIHFFTADMAANPAYRAEDQRFLNQMPDVLGPQAMAALAEVGKILGLDYAGIDFSLNACGEVFLFEANATMVVNPADKDPRWDYRRPAVDRILAATRRLLIGKASRGDE